MRLFIILFFASLVFPDSCNMELIGSLEFDQGLSDITGFYQDNQDGENGREFAVVGLTEDAVAFVDITDPDSPFEVGRIGGTPSSWRDLKYWNRHVYIGTEASDGVKVISVDDPDNPTLVNTITDFTNSHNIYIDTDGFLYVIGAADHDIWIYDLTIPENPVLVGTWDGEYLHDIEVYNNKVYGAGIYTGFFYIIDVNDKTNPTTLVSYNTGGGYISTHDCAVTYDENYLITADETLGGHIKIWDITDYNNINLVSEYMTHPEHSVHNIYIRPETNLVIMSYYVDGTRIIDISDPANPVEVGFYDTSELTGLYDGNWGTYAYLPSGYIISSDRQNGLFIFNSPLSNSALDWNPCPDCAGVPNGDAYEDCAGVCGGDSVLDECGVCDGDGIPDGECNCYGNILDECGICGGDNSICSGCTDPDASNFDPDATIEEGNCEYLALVEAQLPRSYNLQPNFPNPFNPSTTISFSISEFGFTTIIVYDINGRELETLTNKVLYAGNYSVNWDASSYPSGMFFIRMVSGQYDHTQKIMLIK